MKQARRPSPIDPRRDLGLDAGAEVGTTPSSSTDSRRLGEPTHPTGTRVVTSLRLRGRDMEAPSVAIVTGASGGLGRCFALELSRMGTAIVAVARRRRELEETAALISEIGGTCECVVVDVTTPGSAQDAVTVAEAAFGPVDLLVSNAGVAYFAFVERADPTMSRQCFEVNVVAPMQWAAAVVPSMREHHRGRIINISSLAAVLAVPSLAAYSASKAALDQLTACLATEVADDGITVVAFAPAAHTEMSRRLYEDEAMPPALRAQFHRNLVEGGDEMLSYSLVMFRFIVTGGTDHLSGQHVGYHATGRHSVDELRQRAGLAAP